MVVHQNGTLEIHSPKETDSGQLVCIARNEGGEVRLVVNLDVKTVVEKPQIRAPKANVQLAWTLPSGVILSRPQRAGRYTIQPNGTLAIQQVSVYDQGPYVCRASNEYGSSLLSILVNVIAYPPKITNGPPSVTYAKRGVAVQLNCVATGIPKVELAWETPDKIRLAANAKPKLFENKYLLPQGSLIIQNPTQRDAGIYRCTARNAIGFDSKATVLNVCRVPVYNFHRFAYHPFQAFRKCIQFFFFYIEDQFTTTISSGHFTLES
uniref:Ig-like domain-containing protein n=1 Tax=Oreochromis aureus TaxID=47969 RepID=A0A668RC03_OREAU